MIENIINSYNTRKDLSNIDTLIDLLIELENNGIEEVFVNNEYFDESKQIIDIYKNVGIDCVYLSILDMTLNEAINLIKEEKKRENLNYTYIISYL